MSLGTTRRIDAWIGLRGLFHPCIHIHRQGIFLFAGLSYLFHISGIVPSIEDFFRQETELRMPVCGRVGLAFAKHLFPRTSFLVAVGIPSVQDSRMQLFLMLLQVVDKGCRHLTVVCLVGQIAIVAHRTVGHTLEGSPHIHCTNLIFNLHHDDSTLFIHLLDMAHQVGESVGISLAAFCAKGRECDVLISILKLDARKSLGIGLYPSRGVERLSVFPTAKPQNHQLEVFFLSASYHLVNDGIVELSLFWFKQFPSDGCYHRIHVEVGHAFPYISHISSATSGRVMQLST